MRRAPPQDFLDWLKSGCPRGPWTHFDSIAGWHSKLPGSEQTFRSEQEKRDRYRAAVIKAIQDDDKLILTFSSDRPLNFSDIRYIPRIGNLVISGGKASDKPDVVDAEIGLVQLSDMPGLIRLQRCKIGRIEIYRGIKIELRDCWVEELSLQPNSIASLSIRGGGILNIECPTPPQNPFVGPVKVERDVFLPCTRTYGLKTAQPYSSLRVHLNQIGNITAAGAFQRAELRFERQDDTPTNKVFGWLYGLTSDYGTSTGRPLLWALGFFGLAVGLLWWFDGVADPNELQERDWRQFMVGNGSLAGWGRAAVYAIQAVFNPLGIFGARGSLVVVNPWLALAVTILAFLSTVSLFLFAFALRRRFRLG